MKQKAERDTTITHKQETLEEAAEKFRSNNPGTMQGGNNTKILNAFKNGAKWQQERMYNEEEVHAIIESYQNNVENNPNHITYDKWFEKLKKK